MTAGPGPAGASHPVSAQDRLWSAASAELAPAKSLARVDERARQVVTSVSLVGSVLTGLGLVASGRLDRSAPGRALAVAAVCVALVSVVLALASLLLRFTPALAPGNLAEVESWYRRQFRWAYGVVAAGLLLLVAVVMAGVASVVVLTGGGAGREPVVSVQVAGVGDEAMLTVRVELTGVRAGQVLRTDVVGVEPSGARTGLARAVARAGDSGAVATTLEVARVGGYSTVEVTAEVAGRRCTATLAVASTAPAVVACTGR